jgi:signal peptidase I
MKRADVSRQDGQEGLNRRALIWLRELLLAVLPALAVALFVHVFVAEAALVENGPSMQPNLYRGYRVMTEKVSYRLHEPRRGDVVLVDRPEPEMDLIKRVVATAGEVVEVRAGRTYIDGQPIDEPWVSFFGGRSYPPTRVPPDHVFVLGDNRPISRDSRYVGPVPIESLRGRAWLVYWPLTQMKLLLP